MRPYPLHTEPVCNRWRGILTGLAGEDPRGSDLGSVQPGCILQGGLIRQDNTPGASLRGPHKPGLPGVLQDGVWLHSRQLCSAASLGLRQGQSWSDPHVVRWHRNFVASYERGMGGSGCHPLLWRLPLLGVSPLTPLLSPVFDSLASESSHVPLPTKQPEFTWESCADPTMATMP